MWAAVIGVAVKAGVAIWNGSKARHPGGLAIEMAKLCQTYQTHVLNTPVASYKNCDPTVYPSAVAYFESVLGVPIYDNIDIVALGTNDTKTFIANRYGVGINRLDETPNMEQINWAVKVLQKASGNLNIPGLWQFANVIDAQLPTTGKTLAGYKMTQQQIIDNPMAAGLLVAPSTLASSLTGGSTLSTPTNPQVLPEVVVTAKKKSALEQYWYIFAIPLVPLVILVVRYFGKKRRR